MDKTAFTVGGGGGLYRFRSMPFGLCNALATFQRLMEKVLVGLYWQIAVLYIYDIIVFANTVDDHLERLGLVLSRLRQVGLKLKPSKCELLKTSVEFLGHVVSANGVSVDPKKVDKVLTWPEPANLTNVRSFIGLCAYYRRFIPDFSTLAKPLYLLMQNNHSFVWGDEQKAAMSAFKERLISAPILGYPRHQGRFVLDTDASNVGVGCVLSQEQQGLERVIAYGKTLQSAQRNYCVTRRELLAIMVFVKQYHHYLCGARFLIRTDYAALIWLLRKKDPEGQMARWITTLQTYDFEVQHRPGSKHGNLDALSRCMEGCRESDHWQVPTGETCTLESLKNKKLGSILVEQ